MEYSKSKIIKEIAQELDCGNDCYYNPKTGEIISIPNFAQLAHNNDKHYEISIIPYGFKHCNS